MENNFPEISVVMSVFNGENYLKDAVRSILNQTFRNFEFIIICDGSTDNSLEIIKQISNSDNRIKIVSRENRGLTISLNEAIALAKGKFIARMDADDISEETRFQKQIMFLKQNPDVGVVGSNIKIIDEQGHFREILHRTQSFKKIKRRLLHDNQLIHGTLMIRKKILYMINLYDERFDLAQDYDLLLRLSKVTKIVNLKEVLYCWRKNDLTGISVVKRDQQIRYREMAKSRFLKSNYSLKMDFVWLVLVNWIHYPTDPVLTKYLNKLTHDMPQPIKVPLSGLLYIYFKVRNLRPIKWAVEHY